MDEDAKLGPPTIKKKRPYVAPAVVSEDVFEVQALGCSSGSKDTGHTCDPPGPFRS